MVRVVLIGGASLVGKTTLSRGLAARLGAEVVATDGLGRHPGRPWPAPRAHVAEFYRRLSAEAIDAFLLDHHGNLWPRVEALVRARLEGGLPLVVEGSGVRPELAARMLADDRVRGVWLTASEATITDRIARISGRAHAAPEILELIDIFTARTLRDAQRVREAVDRYGLDAVDASDDEARASFLDRFAGAAAPS